MRLTIDEALERGLIGKVEIYLDGQKIHHCIEADEEEGYVVRYLPNAEGRLYLDADGNPKVVRESGKVEIRIRDGAKPA